MEGKVKRTFEFNGKEYEITSCRMFPSKDFGQPGAQGNLMVEIDGLFNIRLMIMVNVNGEMQSTSIFGPSNEHNGTRYTQADFSEAAKRVLNPLLEDLAIELVEEQSAPKNSFLERARKIKGITGPVSSPTPSTDEQDPPPEEKQEVVY